MTTEELVFASIDFIYEKEYSIKIHYKLNLI